MFERGVFLQIDRQFFKYKVDMASLPLLDKAHKNNGELQSINLDPTIDSSYKLSDTDYHEPLTSQALHINKSPELMHHNEIEQPPACSRECHQEACSLLQEHTPITTAQSLIMQAKPEDSARRKRKHPCRMQSFNSGCSKDCWRDCKENISDNQRQRIFNQYCSLSGRKEKQEFITRNVTRIRLSNPTKNFWKLYSVDWAFTIENTSVSVCKLFFLHTLGITESFAYSAIRAKDNILKPPKTRDASETNLKVEKFQAVSERRSLSKTHKKSESFLEVRPGCQDCRRNCHSKFTFQERQAIFDEYHSFIDRQTQHEYLSSLVRRVKKKLIKLAKTRRSCTIEWTLPKNGKLIQVCKTFFTHTVGVSERCVYSIKVKEKIQPAPLGIIYCSQAENQGCFKDDLLSADQLENLPSADDLSSRQGGEISALNTNLEKRICDINFALAKESGKKKKIGKLKVQKKRFLEEASEGNGKTDDAYDDCKIISEVTFEASDEEYEYVYTCVKRKKKKGPTGCDTKLAQIPVINEECNSRDEDEDWGSASEDEIGLSDNTDHLNKDKERKWTKKSVSQNLESVQSDGRNFKMTTGEIVFPSGASDKDSNAFENCGDEICKQKSILFNFKRKSRKFFGKKLEKEKHFAYFKGMSKLRKTNFCKVSQRHKVKHQTQKVFEAKAEEKKRNLTKTKKRPSKLLYPPCDDTCKLMCRYNVPEESRQSIFKEFWDLHTMSAQRNYIARYVKRVYKPVCACVVVNNARKTRGYTISWTFNVEGSPVKVCKTFFMYALQISDSIVYKALLDADKNDSSSMNLTVHPCKHFTNAIDEPAPANATSTLNISVEPEQQCHSLGEIQAPLNQNQHSSEPSNKIASSNPPAHVSDTPSNVEKINGTPNFKDLFKTPPVSASSLQTFENAGPFQAATAQPLPIKSVLNPYSQPKSAFKTLHFPSTNVSTHQRYCEQPLFDADYQPDTRVNCGIGMSMRREGSSKAVISSVQNELNPSSFQPNLFNDSYFFRTGRPNAAHTMPTPNLNMHKGWDTMQNDQIDSSCRFWKTQDPTSQSDSLVRPNACPSNYHWNRTEATNTVRFPHHDANTKNLGVSVNMDGNIDTYALAYTPLSGANPSSVQTIDLQRNHSYQPEILGCAAGSLHNDNYNKNTNNRSNALPKTCNIEKSVGRPWEEQLLPADTVKIAKDGILGDGLRKAINSKHKKFKQKAFPEPGTSLSKREMARRAKAAALANKHVKIGCLETTCKRKCGEKIPQAVREKLLQDFWGLKSIAHRRHYLMPFVKKIPKKSCRGAHSRRSCTVEWMMPNKGEFHIVCKKFFVDTFDIGEKFMKGVLDRKHENSTVEDMRGKRSAHNIAQQAAEAFIKSHCVEKTFICQACVKSFSRWCFNSETESETENSLSRTKMHKLYEVKCKSQGDTPICRATFFKLCTEKFNIIGLKVCDNCCNKS